MVLMRRTLLAIIGVALAMCPVATQAQSGVFAERTPTVPRQLRDSGQQDITLRLRNAPVQEALRQIAALAGLELSWDQSRIPLADRMVTVSLKNVTVQDALAAVLRGTGAEGKLSPDGQTIWIVRATHVARSERASGGIVVGRVVDSVTGAGLGGAQVRIEGVKNRSTVTSDSGNFTLRNVLPGDQVLQVRLFGYRPAQRTVTVVDSERTTVRIVLVPVPTVLSGMVTTAAGVQRRVEIGNDITTLNVDSVMQVAPITNVTDLLETRVPGLIVQHTSGIPGAPSRLRLRGLSSVNSSADPIIIVDGVRVYADQSGTTNPMTGVVTGGGSKIGEVININNGDTVSRAFAGPSALDQIDPNSIDKIEVLKGPSATAIYGSDAGAGVIVITTKHGRTGPTRWNLAVDQGRTTLPGSWPNNVYRFCTLGTSGGSLGICDLTIISDFKPGDELYAIKTDSLVAYQALSDPRYSPLTGDAGQNRDVSLMVEGGSGTLTYAITGTASNQTGYLHLPAIEQQRFLEFHGFPPPRWMRTPDTYGTWGGNSRLGVQLNPRGASLTLTSNLFHSRQQQSSLQSDLAALSTTFVDTTQLAAQPLFPNYYTQAVLNTTTFTNALTLSNWVPWRWLPLTATVGLNVGTEDNHTLTPRDYITCLGNVTDTNCGTDSLGSYALSQGNHTTTSLNASTLLGSTRMIKTAIGMNVYIQDLSGYSAQTIGLPIGVSVPTQFLYTNGGPSYSTANSATYGWYVAPTLNINSRFFVSPGFRLDGGSNSGSGGGGGLLSLFPKLDFSWLAVSRSPSTPMFGVLTLLRPRLAFGVAGVQPGPAQQLRLLTSKEITPVGSSGTTPAPLSILQVSTLGNPQLHPERDQEIEGGVDAEFWNQRLSLTVTGYRKLAIDDILAIPIAPSVAGGWTQSVNIGNVRNTGVEATFFARVLDSRQIDWSVNANVAKNNNLLVSLAPGQPPIVEGGANTPVQSRVTPGFPLFGFWANPVLGFADVNHDGFIEPNEIVVGDSARYVGAPQANYELTMSTTLGFFNNRVSISTSVDYQNGLTQNLTSTNFGLLLNSPGVTPAQQAAVFATLATPASGIGQLQTVSTFRWNTLSINVLVPRDFSRWFRVPNMSVALQGSNLGLHTTYRGKDPNVNVFSSGNLTADDGNALPQPRVWSLRVNLAN